MYAKLAWDKYTEDDLKIGEKKIQEITEVWLFFKMNNYNYLLFFDL